MEGYFFEKFLRGEVLYVPGNFIVSRNLHDEFDVDYSPNNLKAFDEIWKRDAGLIAGLEYDPFISVLDVPDELVHRFQDLCWRDDDVAVANRYIFATELFRNTEEGIKVYRGE